MNLDAFQSTLDIETFNRLFNDYYPRFVRFAVNYISDKATAEDIVMESFTAAWTQRERLNENSLPPYTLTCIKNKCLNHLRDKALHLRVKEEIHAHRVRMIDQQIFTLEACDPTELFSEETQALIEKALQKMPPRTKEIFERSRIHGQTYKEIATEMDITIKSVEFEISKALKLMKIELHDYLPALTLLVILYQIN